MQTKLITAATPENFEFSLNMWLKDGWKLHGQLQVNVVKINDWRFAVTSSGDRKFYDKSYSQLIYKDE